MTEIEKMLAGEYYDPSDPELQECWHHAKKVMKEYNAADSRDVALIDRLQSELLGSKGRNLLLAAPFYVDYGRNIHIGDNVGINMNCVFLDCNRITIGDNTGIGPAVQIYAVSHPVDPRERLVADKENALSKWKEISSPVTIGRNVWIGGGSIILAGVTIGDNTTIGAGSVVTKSVPANCLAAGNPCRVIREL